MKPLISAQELLSLGDSATLRLIDTRSGADARTAVVLQRLRGARYAHLNDSMARVPEDASRGGRHPLPALETFARTLQHHGITPDSHVVVYDDKNGANAAARLWWMLRAVGHSRVQVLDGGLGAALSVGYPVSEGPDLPEPAAAVLPYPVPDTWLLPLADIEAVSDAASDAGMVVIDVREAGRFSGDFEPLDLVAGHIPGAVNLPYSENLAAEGTFQRAEYLREWFEGQLGSVLGSASTHSREPASENEDTHSREPASENEDTHSHPSFNQNVIIHCGSGVTACHTILAMAQAGLPIPRLYVGSWSEWSRSGRPMHTKAIAHPLLDSEQHPFLEQFQREHPARYAVYRAALSHPPPVSIRRNPAKPAKLAIDELRMGDVPWEPMGSYLRERPSFTADPHFHAGAYYVQEASSMLVGNAVRQLLARYYNEGNSTDVTQTGATGAGQHLRVLDLCAAPGGKSTHLASILDSRHLLVANEIGRPRAQILTENLIKWGSPNVVITGNDAAHFRTLGSWFDLIVVDAPCSGEGLFRRDPDAETHWSAEAVTHCAVRQQQILSDIWPALKPGGFLLYSTCTFNRTENDITLEKLLSTQEANAINIDISSKWGVLSEEIPVNTPSGKNKATIYRCFPGLLAGEGFTLTVVQKRPDVAPEYGSTRGKSRYRRVTTHPQRDKLRRAEGLTLWQSDQQTFAVPVSFDLDFSELSDGLYIHHAGVGLGDAKRPDHSLALSQLLLPGAYLDLELTTELAISYLRRESIPVSGELHGMVRLTYGGLGLGFGKAVRGRLNNHYPQEWRIRMR